jgi:hypothetical protein
LWLVYMEQLEYGDNAAEIVAANMQRIQQEEAQAAVRQVEQVAPAIAIKAWRRMLNGSFAEAPAAQPGHGHSRLAELEEILSHDVYDPVQGRDALWAELVTILEAQPGLRTILSPESFGEKAEETEIMIDCFFCGNPSHICDSEIVWDDCQDMCWDCVDGANENYILCSHCRSGCDLCERPLCPNCAEKHGMCEYCDDDCRMICHYNHQNDSKTFQCSEVHSFVEPISEKCEELEGQAHLLKRKIAHLTDQKAQLAAEKKELRSELDKWTSGEVQYCNEIIDVDVGNVQSGIFSTPHRPKRSRSSGDGPSTNLLVETFDAPSSSSSSSIARLIKVKEEKADMARGKAEVEEEKDFAESELMGHAVFIGHLQDKIDALKALALEAGADAATVQNILERTAKR